MGPLVLQGLSYAVGGRELLVGVNAVIASPGITAVIGPNGAGKSITLRLIDGLLQPDAGTIRFRGRPIAEARRAFVFQKPGLIRASVARNVALALAPLGLDRAEKRSRIAAALDRVGLQDRASDPARKLSGGEQQRLALARAWATEPKLLLLDEPTANLDPGATEAVEALVRGMARAGTKVVLVSHNLGQVARLSEDVLVLSGGRAAEYGPTQSVLTTPRTPEARAYIKGELPWTSFVAVS